MKLIKSVFFLMFLVSMLTTMSIYGGDSKNEKNKDQDDKKESDYQVEIKDEIVAGDIYIKDQVVDDDSSKMLVTAEYLETILNEAAYKVEFPNSKEDISFSDKKENADIVLKPTTIVGKVIVNKKPKSKNSLVSKEFALDAVYTACMNEKDKEIKEKIKKDKNNQNSSYYHQKNKEGMQGQDKKVFVKKIIVKDSINDDSYADQAITREYIIEKSKLFVIPVM